MLYQILPPQLQSLADAAVEFCRQEWGIPASRVRVETALARDIGFVPTLSADTPEYYHLCIEVSTRVYSSTLDAFVLDCKNRGLPVKLYVAIPHNAIEGDFKSELSRARSNGVGVIEFDETVGTILQDALALSLTGLRAVSAADFPLKYRQAVSTGVRLFHSGSPVKACSVIYDEVEQLTRRLAKRAMTKGWWRTGGAPSVNPDTEAWAGLTRLLMNRFDASAASCPLVKEPLLARVLGVTTHRNEAGHKPNTVAKIQRRDRELRTRFEGAIDLLTELIEATRPLKL